MTPLRQRFIEDLQVNPLIVEGEYHVRTILVAEGRLDGDEDDRRIYLWIDAGERDAAAGPILTYCQLPCEPFAPNGSAAKKPA